MIEKDPMTGFWRHPQPVNNTEKMIDDFWKSPDIMKDNDVPFYDPE